MNTCLAFMNLGGGDLIFISVAVLVLFGAKKIPEFAKGLGQGIKEFKKASREVTDEIQNSVNEQSAAPAPRPIASVQTTSTAPPSTVPKA